MKVDLTAERRNRGMSKAAMAKWIGIGYATWWAAEQGESISPASQKAIADKLGLTVTQAFPEPAPIDPVPAGTGEAA
ncbi:MAG TPA: helix-turn-helix transcriptional regulator [Solirubrobacterales bacterium]|nr:helix-turn-helix transcriptional regulator [Solirubrobacterales bacterium]